MELNKNFSNSILNKNLFFLNNWFNLMHCTTKNLAISNANDIERLLIVKEHVKFT